MNENFAYIAYVSSDYHVYAIKVSITSNIIFDSSAMKISNNYPSIDGPLKSTYSFYFIYLLKNFFSKKIKVLT